MAYNPFRSKSKIDVIREANEKKVVDGEFGKVIDNAKHLLSSEWGIKYKNDLEATKDALIRYCLRNVNPDPVKDAFMLRTALAKLAVIYDILERIETDAG